MKKKYIVIALLSTGIILLCISIILAIIATGNKNIIGGADLPTFLFVFTCEKNGLYSTLANWGIFGIIVSTIVAMVKKRK